MKKLKNLFFIAFLFLSGITVISCTDVRPIPPAIHKAAERGDKAEVERLLNEGVSIHLKDYSHQTPLHYASQAGETEMVLFLIEQGADANKKDKTNETPLNDAHNVKIAEILLDNGADIDAQDTHFKRTALHNAIIRKKSDLALFFINRGANLYTEDKQGWTPISSATLYSNKEVIRALIKKGVDPNIKGKNGLSAMSIAEERNDQELIELFKTYTPPDNVK